MYIYIRILKNAQFISRDFRAFVVGLEYGARSLRILLVRVLGRAHQLGPELGGLNSDSDLDLEGYVIWKFIFRKV